MQGLWQERRGRQGRRRTKAALLAAFLERSQRQCNRQDLQGTDRDPGTLVIQNVLVCTRRLPRPPAPEL